MLLTKEMKLNVSQQLLPGLPECALLAVRFLAFSGSHLHQGNCVPIPRGAMLRAKAQELERLGQRLCCNHLLAV